MMDAVRTAFEAIQKTKSLDHSSRGRSQTNVNCRLDRPHPSLVGNRIMDMLKTVSAPGCAFLSLVGWLVGWMVGW